MINLRNCIAVILLVISAGCAFGRDAEKTDNSPCVPTSIPIKEVTVFKDGHAFIMHSGTMPTDEYGNVVMDYLPTPVLGTFWSYSAEKNAPLTAVIASRDKIEATRSVQNLRDLLKANIGAEVSIRDYNNKEYEAVIADVPEPEPYQPNPNIQQPYPQQPNLVLLETSSGVKAIGIDKIQEIVFLSEDYKITLPKDDYRNSLTLKLDWKDGKTQKQAEVGMMYLQKGLRWIPSYKVVIDGKGKAKVKLQATLENDLADLDDADMNLVIGVPTFTFAGMTDPIALQQVAAQVEAARREGRMRGGFDISNAIMSQSAAYAPRAGAAMETSAPLPSPIVQGAESNEDLFVFSVKHVTLKKGQRMVIPVKEFELEYKDVYTLAMPYSPPPEVWSNFNQQQIAQIVQEMAAPKVIHNIRLKNKSGAPLTTAPALLMLNDSVLAQGMMKYTSIGGEGDLAITQAVDIKVEKKDTETQRTPNAVTWDGNHYMRVDLAGKITITNYRKNYVYLEVTRYVLGQVDECDMDGKIEMINTFENPKFIPLSSMTQWWGWYNWPHWWHRFNGIGQIEWKQEIPAGKNIELTYTWHYFWR